MRVLNLLLLLLLLAGAASAQAVSNNVNASGLTVIQKSWRRVEPRSRALDEDPLRVNQQQADLERAMKETLRVNDALVRAGQQPLPIPTRGRITTIDNPAPLPGRDLPEYLYQTKVRNDGAKAIRRVTWEYVFFDPSTKREVGRRWFENKVKIAPGKTKTIVAHSVSPPTRTINAAQVGKRLQDQYTEEISIESIEYADGSVWLRK